MSYALLVNYQLMLTARETLGLNVPAASKPTVVHDAFNTQGTMQVGAIPPAAAFAAFQQALVAGAGTIDLTNLLGTNDMAVNGTGLAVQAVRFQVPAANLHPLVIQPGGSNPYNLFGAVFKIELFPGADFVWVNAGGNAVLPAIGGTAKLLAISDGGAGATEACNYESVMG